jgi:hypothetical protein
MAARSYQRRLTGEMAAEPALYQLVMTSASVMDRLLCAGSPPVPGGTPPLARQYPSRAFEPKPAA